MASEITPGKPTTRRYTPAEKEQAVRLVRQLRAELGTEHGTVQRVAGQLGYCTESVRSWVAQADIDDGRAPGITSTEAKRIAELEQENRELKRSGMGTSGSGGGPQKRTGRKAGTALRPDPTPTSRPGPGSPTSASSSTPTPG